MVTQFDFSNDDWQEVANAPVLIGMAVARAEESGFVGSIRETRALVSTIADGAAANPAGELIAQAAATDTSLALDAYKSLSAEALANDAEQACLRLSELLGAVAGEHEADGYKRWLVEVAAAVADAAKEQGHRVSPGEVSMIERISRSLGLSSS